MLTVSIDINGRTIYARTAVNVTHKEPHRSFPDGADLYRLDDGTLLPHVPEHGAVALAKKMLDTIREEGAARPAGGAAGEKAKP